MCVCMYVCVCVYEIMFVYVCVNVCMLVAREGIGNVGGLSGVGFVVVEV